MSAPIKGYAVVGQSGGPTAVINRSLIGVVTEALKQPAIQGVYGALNGVQGMLEGRFIDFSVIPDALLRDVAQTPGAGLGSCRYKPTREDCEKIFKTFEKMGVHYFFYIGGNDSALSAGIINKIAKESKHELRVFHVPKTIDNDLLVTDHTPGYGSAAKYVAQCFMGNDADNRALPGIKIDICMGRNAGWLTAASALARKNRDDGPHLIYLPERPISVRKFCEDVDAVYRRLGRCLVAVSEGVTHQDRKIFFESKSIRDELRSLEMGNLAERLQMGQEKDAFGHVQLSGTGALADFLSALLQQYLQSIYPKDPQTGNPRKFRIRADTLGYAQRCMAGVVSDVDAAEASEAGVAAVRYAMRGDVDGSICFRRYQSPTGKYLSDSYRARLEDVSGVDLPEGEDQHRIMDDPRYLLHSAPQEPLAPDEDPPPGYAQRYPHFIAPSGNDVTPEFIDWARPLLGGLPVKGHLPERLIEV